MFISMIGLEDRVLGAINKIALSSVNKFVFFINDEYLEDQRVIKYKADVFKLVNTDAADILKSSYDNSLKLVESFNYYMSTNAINPAELDVILDISTFNRQNLLTMLFLLRRKYGIKKVQCCYTIPEETNDMLSKYAQHAATIPFFAGEQSVDKNKLLLLLAGYEYDRALYLWEKVEPSKTILGVGNRPTDKKFYQRNITVVNEIAKSIGDHERVDICADNPFDAKTNIEAIIERYSTTYNIIISPMNTKLQTLGLYLAWEKYPDTQIIYSRPEEFSEWLTRGIKKSADNPKFFDLAF